MKPQPIPTDERPELGRRRHRQTRPWEPALVPITAFVPDEVSFAFEAQSELEDASLSAVVARVLRDYARKELGPVAARAKRGAVVVQFPTKL